MCPSAPRVYTSKAKNAQEAHEAIRPTSFDAHARQDRRAHLDADQAQALRADLEARRRKPDGKRRTGAHHRRCRSRPTSKITLRATGTVTLFDGFLTLYQEGKDDESRRRRRASCRSVAARRRPQASRRSRRRSISPSRRRAIPKQPGAQAGRTRHRPAFDLCHRSFRCCATAPMCAWIANRFIPEDKGRLVTAFLANFFERYVEYGFTADLEEKLDEVSAGELDWKQLLRDFWKDFSAAIGEHQGSEDLAGHRRRSNEILGPHIFPASADGGDPRKCPACGDGRLEPEARAVSARSSAARIIPNAATRASSARTRKTPASAQPRELGKDPETGETIIAAQRPLRALRAARRRREAATRRHSQGHRCRRMSISNMR